MDVPRHMSQHERAESMRLVTDDGTVTLVEAMDESRNDEILAAVRDQLSRSVGDPSWLRAVDSGADYEWGRLYERLREADASQERIDAIRTLAERFERPYPSLTRVRVAVDPPIDFVPGQYVTLRAHGTPRAYSIANSPSEDELELCIRRVPGGRLTSELFVHSKSGDSVVVRGPNGEMVLDDPSEKDMVFLATSTGVAPFKSMIDYTFEQGWDTVDGDPRDIWLFLGCGWEDDLPYDAQFRAYDREYDHFHYVPTLSRERLLTEWDGETNYVQQVLLAYIESDAIADVELPSSLSAYRSATPRQDIDARIDPADAELYACGMSAMVRVLVRAGRAVGFEDSEMQYEGFG
jgi:CDP-4-dehydro-6-deoxyglucose reductase